MSSGIDAMLSACKDVKLEDLKKVTWVTDYNNNKLPETNEMISDVELPDNVYKCFIELTRLTAGLSRLQGAEIKFIGQFASHLQESKDVMTRIKESPVVKKYDKLIFYAGAYNISKHIYDIELKAIKGDEVTTMKSQGTLYEAINKIMDGLENLKAKEKLDGPT